MGEKKGNYKNQAMLSFLQFLSELPNFIVVTVSALLTGSMIVWMDFIDSLGHFLRAFMVLILSKRLSKDLRYTYNYGVAKLEDITVLLCDGIVMCCLTIATLSSIFGLINPNQQSGLLGLVAIWKVLGVTLDSLFLFGQYKIKKSGDSVLAKSNFSAILAALLFDAANLISVLLVWIFNDQVWTWYFSPVVSIMLAIYLGFHCIKRVRKAISELSDKTVSEEEQMHILRAFTRYRGRAKLRSVKSHRVGDCANIDLELSFNDDVTYAEMVEIKAHLQEQLSKDISKSTVNIII